MPRRLRSLAVALLLAATLTPAAGAAGITVSPANESGFVTLHNGLYAATWDETVGSLPEVFYWVDDGKGTPLASGRGDGIVQATEIRSLAPPHPQGIAFATPNGILEVNGLLTISYTYYINTGDTERDIWIDANNDNEVTSGEKHLQSISAAPAPFEKLQLYNGRRASVHGAMKVWIDDGKGGGIADDGVVNGGEDRAVFTVTPTGGLLAEGISSKSLGTIAGHMAVHYTYLKHIDEGAGNSRQETQLYLWVDDGNGGGIADDQVANGGEIRTLELIVRNDVNFVGGAGSGNLFEVGGRAAIAYARVNPVLGPTNNYKASVWIDDGHGGGTAGDLVEQAGEIRDIEIVENEATIQTGLSYNGKAAVAYITEGNSTGGKLKFWVDDGRTGGTASDGVPNGGEIQTLDGPTVAFDGQAIQAGPKLLSLYFHKTQNELKLWTIDVPPGIASVNPATGFALGDTLVTVNGGNFFAGTTVSFGGAAATDVTVVNDRTLTVRTPPHAVGVVDVVVTNGDGLSATLAGSYTYQPNPPPSLTSITPLSGAAFGGSLMTVNGDFFQVGATVLVGGKPLLNLQRVNSRLMRGTVPLGAEGAVDVSVVNPDGGTATLPGAFTYNLGSAVTDVEQSKFFPSPFRPKQGHNAMIVNAPDGSTIRIFDISGNLVKELHTVGSGVLWDVRNESGEDLASGIYVYLVTDPAGNKFKNRIMVIR